MSKIAKTFVASGLAAHSPADYVKVTSRFNRTHSASRCGTQVARTLRRSNALQSRTRTHRFRPWLPGDLRAQFSWSAWQCTRVNVRKTVKHLHDLRHTGLTLAAATGVATLGLMYLAGHLSSVAATRYQPATKDRDRIIADALGGSIDFANLNPIR